jgi:predicted phosphodiesterase
VKFLSNYNKHLTEKELEALQTYEGACAVVLGYLYAERGKVVLTHFNQLVKPLGYGKENKKSLQELVSKAIQTDEVLSSLLTKAKRRQVGLNDIPKQTDDEEEDEETPGTISEQDVFNHLTPALIDSEENNARLREMRKLQRDGIHMERLFKSLEKTLAEELNAMPRAKHLVTPLKYNKGEEEKSLVLVFGDWHVGVYTKNSETGDYNFEKLTTMLDNIVQFAATVCAEKDIEHLYIFHVGDFTEHVDMRNVNQAFEAEFNLSEQIAKSTSLITDILIKLSKERRVTFGCVGGNHDRMQGNKADKIYNDNIAYGIVHTLIDIVQGKFKQLPNVDIIDNRDDVYNIELTIAGSRVKLTHGDMEKKKQEQKINKHIKKHPIDLLLMGHFHGFSAMQEDYARMSLTSGSTVGANNYGKELNLASCSPSQLMVTFEHGRKTPILYPLMLDEDGELI